MFDVRKKFGMYEVTVHYIIANMGGLKVEVDNA